MKTTDSISLTLNSLSDFLSEKNKRYGDSALKPIGIFTNHVSKENSSAENNFFTRLDDKLSRIKNSNELRKNDVVDLLGYLVLLCVYKEWTNFEDLLD